MKKTLKKTERRRSVSIEKKGSGVVYAWGRYQHPMCLSQGMTTFNRVCKNLISMLFIFPFYVSLFLGSTRVLPLLLRILRCDEEFRPTQLFKSKCLCVKLIFYIFERFISIAKKSRSRRWTLKRCFKFSKAERIVKALDLETIF